MNRVSGPLAAGLLWLACLPGTAAGAAAGAEPLAQSAQLTVESTVAGDWLTLRILHTGTQSPVVTRDVTVSVAGRVVPTTPRGDGTFVLPVKQLGATTEPKLDIVVGHDGIHEIVSGKVTVPTAAPVSQGGHTQSLWWIINIALVFAAAMFISSRKKKPAE
jgi:hypothetical protein